MSNERRGFGNNDNKSNVDDADDDYVEDWIKLLTT